MRIAIIQPYFFPYAGYFRLFSLTDLFVVFDCVQFPRRGWVHRNRIKTADDNYHWLTLPLKKQARTTTIKDLQFHDNVIEEWPKRLAPLKQLFLRQANHALYEFLYDIRDNPVKELLDGLAFVCQQLSFPQNIIRSSSLNIPLELKGQERVIAICRKLGAKEYLNAPGGRSLYHKEAFGKHGIKLQYLDDYKGGYQSILQRLFSEKITDILNEINSINNREILPA